MIRWRSASVIAAQRAISSSDRLHPAQSAVLTSITHTLMQGDWIGLFISAEVRRTAPASPAGM
jgi:hypothetical protein